MSPFLTDSVVQRLYWQLLAAFATHHKSTLWPLILTFKFVRARDQIRLPSEFGTNPFSGSRDTSCTNKKVSERQKQNLTQFTACGKYVRVERKQYIYLCFLTKTGFTIKYSQNATSNMAIKIWLSSPPVCTTSQSLTQPNPQKVVILRRNPRPWSTTLVACNNHYCILHHL